MHNILQSGYFKNSLIAFLIVTVTTTIITACIPSPRPPLGNGTLTIGVLLTGDSSAVNYEDLKTYLEKKLRLSLDPVIQVQIDAQKYSLKELRNNIISKKWDIVFTVSPAVSVVAEANDYEFIARMYPNNDPYFEATIFVSNNSSIQGLNNITPDKTIALGAFDNVPAFYIPIYDLYGKTIRISKDNSLDQIIEKVKLGKADVGAGVYPLIKNNPDLRVINRSRVIPVAGVYLSHSNRINKREYQEIKKAFLTAPLEVQKKANYTKSDKLDYKQFRQIATRVETVIECSDWTQNPVKLFCERASVTPTNNPIPTNAPSGTVRGEVNGYSIIDSQKIRLTLQGEDNKVYSVILPQNVLNQVPNAPPPQGLNFKTIQVENAQSNQRDGTIELQITKPEQLRIL